MAIETSLITPMNFPEEWLSDRECDNFLQSGWVAGNVIRSVSCSVLMEPVEHCVLKLSYLTLSPSASLLVNNSLTEYLYFRANENEEKPHVVVAVYLTTFTWPFILVVVNRASEREVTGMKALTPYLDNSGTKWIVSYLKLVEQSWISDLKFSLPSKFRLWA